MVEAHKCETSFLHIIDQDIKLSRISPSSGSVIYLHSKKSVDLIAKLNITHTGYFSSILMIEEPKLHRCISQPRH